MKFVRTFYVLIVVFVEKGEKLFVRCTAGFEETELEQLSQKLNPLECLKLIHAMYEIMPTRRNRDKKRVRNLNEGTNHVWLTPKTCLVKLEKWNSDFPDDMKPRSRSTMEMSLRWLGRPELAKYVREHRRPFIFLNTLGFPGHKVLRRHTSKSNKNSPVKKKKKKTNHQKHSRNPHGKNKGVQKAMTKHKTHHDPKKGNAAAHSSKNKSFFGQHRSTCLVLFGLIFLSACIVVVFSIRRGICRKICGTRLKCGCGWFSKAKDRYSPANHCGWRRKEVCFCSEADAESGWDKKYSTCCNAHRKNNEHHRSFDTSGTDMATSVCVQRVHRKKKKRKRFGSIFNCQDKKKERKTSKKCPMKKRERLSNIPNDHRQCMCCKCITWNLKDHTVGRDRENAKEVQCKVKRKKRKKERLNVCTKNTCD